MYIYQGFPGGSVVKNLSASAGDTRDAGLIPGLGRSPGGGNGNPLQYFCLENSMDRGAWWAAVHGVVKSWTRLSNFSFTFHFHASEKEMATHSSVLAWRIPGTGAWWAAIRGVAQSRTWLTWLSSSSSRSILNLKDEFWLEVIIIQYLVYLGIQENGSVNNSY